MTSHAILARHDAPLPDDGSVIIGDAFSWAAFWFGGIWLLFFGLWRMALPILLMQGIAVWSIITPGWTFFGVLFLLCLALLVGLEAGEWRSRSLMRRGYILIDRIESPDSETAFAMHAAGWSGSGQSEGDAQPLAPRRFARQHAPAQTSSIGLVEVQRDGRQ